MNLNEIKKIPKNRCGKKWEWEVKGNGNGNGNGMGMGWEWNGNDLSFVLKIIV